MSEAMIILGASARAAAQSAARAGFSPWAIDLFADADLARLCPVERIDRYPCDLFAAARRAPPGPWMYTGGLENYPHLVERISAERRLLGNPGAVLRRVRDPSQLSTVVRRTGLAFPQMAASAAGLPRDGSWLRKALRSSGGLRVELWDANNTAADETRGWYFQERVAGASHSAVFIADGRSSRLLGVTRQYVGGDGELGSIAAAPPFHYAGSVGPVVLPEQCVGRLNILGNLLAAEFQLVGLFGIDFILDGETLWAIEINPRFPASVEVLERALEFSGVGLHVSACRDGELPAASPIARSKRVVGKAILHAARAIELQESVRLQMDAKSRAELLPAIADIPAASGEISTGQPILTLLSEGATDLEVSEGLERRLRELQRELESA